MATLKIEGVKKRYGALEILKGIDLALADGEFLVFLGPSGCGKSTLLNIIAGLDTLSEGRIVIDERVVNDVHPKDRDIAMVFQSYALYPNMTVARNIAFALEMRGLPRAEREAAVRKVAGLLQIEHLLDRKPAQLSGGQRQRVAIGRALVRDPKIFLFDEPLSNLDARLRVDMRTEIKKLHQRLGTTIVYVTHDQIEAMTLASRIAVMRDGLVQQFATPQEVYERPANMYVAGFIGSPPMNFVTGRIAQEDNRLGVAVERIAHAKTAPLFLPLPDPAAVAGMAGRPIVLGVRPEAIGFANGADHPAHVRFDCAVSVLEPTGADTMAIIRLGEREAVARIRPSDPAAPGATAPFVIDMTKVNLFDPQSERRI
jgi:multiple sugar transport system ATP-binding protein